MAKKRKAKKTKIKRKGTPNKNKPQKKWSTPKVKKWLPAKDDALIVEWTFVLKELKETQRAVQVRAIKGVAEKSKIRKHQRPLAP
jgi:hypothetical protein